MLTSNYMAEFSVIFRELTTNFRTVLIILKKCKLLTVFYTFLDTNFMRYMICKYIISFCVLSSHFFVGIICSTKSFYFNEILFIYLSFIL